MKKNIFTKGGEKIGPSGQWFSNERPSENQTWMKYFTEFCWILLKKKR